VTGLSISDALQAGCSDTFVDGPLPIIKVLLGEAAARNRIQVFDRIIERPGLEQGLVDAAPPMFSTTIVPSRGFIFSAHGRPTTSNAAPRGKGITSRIGRVG
jgi:hypothetical protein